MESQYWHVCYLRPKSEKIVYNKIEKLNVGVFLPLIRNIRIYKTTKKATLLPVFPGYIFVRIGPGKRHYITALPEVYCFVKFGNEFARVSEEEIKNLKLIIQNTKQNEIFSEITFQKGRNIEITQGPFYGMKGKMIKRNGKHRIVVEVKAINQALSIEVDAKQLCSSQ